MAKSQMAKKVTPSRPMKGPLPTTLPSADTLRFSFKFLNDTCDEFQFEQNDTSYFLKLLQRLRDISHMKMSDMSATPGHRTLRWHPITWSETIRPNGFDIPVDGANANAWQFSITKSAHGRVHGFLIESTFFIVWLDSNHSLYSS